MCGISGIIHKDTKESALLIKKMTDAIFHRGPDDEGFFVTEGLALGMRRLSIIDLESGKQPISSSDNRYTIVFNGEIYNYKELKQELISRGQSFSTESDTEVILKMFEVYGEDSFKRLRGMFVFAIYDSEEKILRVVRDLFGIKPLYYWKEAGLLKAFASEIKSFVSLPGWKPEVNDQAVFNYLSYQYNPLEETFFKNVYKLSPAHFLKLDLSAEKFEIKRYAEVSLHPEESLDELLTKKKILKTMEDSVAHHMIADVPVGSFLSGGIDSSVIATLMQNERGESKVRTFTVGFDTLSEGAEAKETSGPLGTLHKEITVGRKEYFEALEKAVWHFDEPVADPSAIGLYFLAREARKEVKVVLSGEGSDELFGGYNIYLAPLARAKMAWLPRFVLKFFLALPFEYFGKNYLRRVEMKLEDWYIGNASVFGGEEARKIWRGPSVSKFVLTSIYERAFGLSDSAKMQYIDLHTWLVGDILAKADKMTMAHSLELRVPFLDKEVYGLARTLPDRFKWRFGETKYLLREAFKNILPESVRKRKKLGFPTPLRTWLKEESGEVESLVRNNTYIQSHLDLSYVEKLFHNHSKGTEDNSRKIYLLLLLAIWYNTFIEKPQV